MAQVDKSFRPLAGSKVSEPIQSLLLLLMILVSVPSRGVRYLNEEKEATEKEADSFRPLAGIKVSEHPSGKMLFKTWQVSVPSRGLRYLNFLNEYKHLSIDEFPSPRGD